jgi:membrane protease YdiL (CAAX protease family)
MAVFLPCFPIRTIATFLFSLKPDDLPTFINGFYWILGGLVLLYVVLVERLPLSSIGLGRLTWQSLAYGVLAFVATFAFVGGVIIGVILPYLHLTQSSSALAHLYALPFWFRCLIVLRAGVVEEILMRGYGIERIQELTGSRFVAGAVTLAAFTLAHLSYWSAAQLLVAAGAGLVLTVLYLWRRDLWANMIAHFLTDAVSLLA